MTRLDELLYEMIRYDDRDVKRIQHFLKVHEFARLIGLEEKLDPYTQEILEAAAIVHDIGIHKAEEKYGRNTGKYQELEGPGEARTMLTALSWPEEVIDRVCYLVGHHHTYDNIDGMDYQILVEADFLVNLFEDGATPDTQKSVFARNFRTEGGKSLFGLMFESGEEKTGENTCHCRETFGGTRHRSCLKMQPFRKRMSGR